ncbi:MAG: helix-turn-helix domain-containing protein [Chloroflexota bacterium]|nr:helix-turn-helix domain-containing protein [Chloroflexota bacterium]
MLLRPDEVAAALGLSRSRVYELLGSGELPSVRIGKSIRVSVTSLERWIAKLETGTVTHTTDNEEGLRLLRR